MPKYCIVHISETIQATDLIFDTKTFYLTKAKLVKFFILGGGQIHCPYLLAIIWSYASVQQAKWPPTIIDTNVCMTD